MPVPPFIKLLRRLRFYAFTLEFFLYIFSRQERRKSIGKNTIQQTIFVAESVPSVRHRQDFTLKSHGHPLRASRVGIQTVPARTIDLILALTKINQRYKFNAEIMAEPLQPFPPIRYGWAVTTLKYIIQNDFILPARASIWGLKHLFTIFYRWMLGASPTTYSACESWWMFKILFSNVILATNL